MSTHRCYEPRRKCDIFCQGRLQYPILVFLIRRDHITNPLADQLAVVNGASGEVRAIGIFEWLGEYGEGSVIALFLQ
jgi:hypothetical protein